MFLTTRRGAASLTILLCAGVAYCSLEIVKERRSRYKITDVAENATDVEDYPESVTTPEELPTTTGGPVKNYEEYFVEHDTSYNESKHMFKYLINNKSLDFVPPYCGDCSQDEISYCTSNVIQDHCCCDKKYSEAFAWLPHTCYFGPQPCALFAKDCETYELIRDCCCNKILKDKGLKIYHLSNSENIKKVPHVLIIFLLFVMGVVFNFSL